MWYIIGIGGDVMEEEKVVETAPVETVEEETAPVETVEEEKAPVEETVEKDSNEDVLTLLREVLTEIKALSILVGNDTSVQVEDVDDGSNDNNADELEKQLEDFDF